MSLQKSILEHELNSWNVQKTIHSARIARAAPPNVHSRIHCSHLLANLNLPSREQRSNNNLAITMLVFSGQKFLIIFLRLNDRFKKKSLEKHTYKAIILFLLHLCSNRDVLATSAIRDKQTASRRSREDSAGAPFRFFRCLKNGYRYFSYLSRYRCKKKV